MYNHVLSNCVQSLCLIAGHRDRVISDVEYPEGKMKSQLITFSLQNQGNVNYTGKKHYINKNTTNNDGSQYGF